MATVPTATGTYLSDLFNPQVIGDLINAELTNKMVFAPITRVDYTLAGRPGNAVTLPKYAYIGDAVVVPEGTDIPLTKLTETTTSVTIKKYGKGVQLTDEAVLSGYGDPIGEAARQIALSIDSAFDNDIYALLNAITGTMAYTGGSTFSADDVNNALVKFGEKIDGTKYLYVNPADYAILRKSSAWVPASEIAARITVSGVVGEIYGCEVIVSNKLTTDNVSFIVKPETFRTFVKRETLVETDRDIINKSTVLTADKHAVNYLYNDIGAIKLSK